MYLMNKMCFVQEHQLQELLNTLLIWIQLYLGKSHTVLILGKLQWFFIFVSLILRWPGQNQVTILLIFLFYDDIIIYAKHICFVLLALTYIDNIYDPTLILGLWQLQSFKPWAKYCLKPKWGSWVALGSV